jgi:hypothetical protein
VIRPLSESSLLETELLDSKVGRMANRVSRAASTAWKRSATRRLIAPYLSDWQARPPADRVRSAASVAAVAMAFERIVSSVASRPLWLSWVIPVCVFVACLAIAATSERICRATGKL